MSDVFVSYKAEDRRRVKPLVEALQAAGLTVWWDAQIGGGDEWRRSIEQQLDGAKCVLVVWSKRSTAPEGRFVRDEASRAMERNVYLPVRIDNVRLPLGFGETQALSLAGWKGSPEDSRFRAVLGAVRAIATGKPHDGGHNVHLAEGVSRRGVLAGAGVAAAAVAGVGAWFLLKPAAASASGSIAVLPFENLSGDPAQAYFSDGVAEEIRSALARVAGLKVVGRTSSEAVRNDDAETAAKKLGVANILSGSVRQSPSTIRVSAELVDGRSGIDKWSQDYDRSPGDAIKIQTDIAENVATALSAALGAAARAVVSVGGTTNAAAQNMYLKAKAQLRADDSEASLRNGIGLLDSAIALDPKFADAFAEKAYVLTNLNGYFTAKDGRFEPGFREAAAVARQSISLAPNLAAGHMALANIFVQQLDIGSAAVEFRKGHSLAGHDVGDLLAYGAFLSVLGNQEEAVDLARQAQSSDPLNPTAYGVEASALAHGARYSEAVAAYRKALALAPNRSLDRALMAWALWQSGNEDQALAELRKLPPDYLFRLVGEAIIFARDGKRAESDAALARAQQLNGDAANYQYAEIHAQRGEKEEAFAALDRAWAFRDPGLALMKSDRFLDPVRSDPRFAALLQKMNFPA